MSHATFSFEHTQHDLREIIHGSLVLADSTQALKDARAEWFIEQLVSLLAAPRTPEQLPETPLGTAYDMLNIYSSEFLKDVNSEVTHLQQCLETIHEVYTVFYQHPDHH